MPDLPEGAVTVRELVETLQKLVAEQPDIADYRVLAGIESEGTNYRVEGVVPEFDAIRGSGFLCLECPGDIGGYARPDTEESPP